MPNTTIYLGDGRAVPVNTSSVLFASLPAQAPLFVYSLCAGIKWIIKQYQVALAQTC